MTVGFATVFAHDAFYMKHLGKKCTFITVNLITVNFVTVGLATV